LRDSGEAPARFVKKLGDSATTDQTVDGTAFLATTHHAGLWRCTYWDKTGPQNRDMKVGRF